MEKEKRRRGWLERIRRLFSSSEPKQKPAKAEGKQPAGRSRRWLPGKKLLRTQQSFALPAPAAAAEQSATVRQQAEEEQSKHAMAVALATAAAAEAAVAAAHAAAEVVRLTGAQQQAQASRPRPSGGRDDEDDEEEEERAAVAIQSAYRGYLARRALRALKGLVRLQALIRGQAVRRQTAATLRGLESLVRIQARNRSSRRSAGGGGGIDGGDDDALLLRRGRELYGAAAAAHEQQQMQNKGWDSSIFSKEEASAISRSREEAAFKRLRALQYASLQNEKMGIRRPPMSKDEADALNQRWSWLEEWVGSHHQAPFEKDVPVEHQSPYNGSAAAAADVAKTPHHHQTPRASLAGAGADDDRLLGSCSARRSFVRPRRAPARADHCGGYYYYDDTCSPAAGASAATPGYMASTASAKAKFRSMSTPKERHAGAAGSDAFSEHCFPFADRMLSPIPSMSPIPSIASDLGFAFATTRSSVASRPPGAQRSPRVAAGKGSMTPARSRSRRSPGHHSFGSEAALHQLQMEHYTPVR